MEVANAHDMDRGPDQLFLETRAGRQLGARTFFPRATCDAGVYLFAGLPCSGAGLRLPSYALVLGMAGTPMERALSERRNQSRRSLLRISGGLRTDDSADGNSIEPFREEISS